MNISEQGAPFNEVDMTKITFIIITYVLLSGCASQPVHYFSSHPVPDLYDTALPEEKGEVSWGIAKLRYR